ncbi:esterase [Streptomyces sp. 150FB]|uniref:alpha/beta hydrolase n=1 Tax=Streptomyces sp. 150FB TaxID=1576605 RepID=UPI00058931EA|nr:alpha/beta hydrolase [Streptomyces sp. 150FB]KIF75678.1 esterase [Streptomyces sp. 150FB]
MTSVTRLTDLTYAEVDGRKLRLDLYRPDIDGPVPAVVHLHGGGWSRGDKAANAEVRLAPLAAHGVAVLSVEYRLVPEVVFPAPVRDVKAAVRWTRAHGAEYGLLTDRIGLWGASAGAMLASLAGLTPGDPEFEVPDSEGSGGTGADYAPEHSSDVQAVVHWFGPTDFVSSATRSPLEAAIRPPGPEVALFGPGSADEVADVARRASPLLRVSSTAPPFLIMHGDRDRMVPISESQALHDALSRAGARSTFVSLAGAGHEDPSFNSAPNVGMTAAFLLATLSP